MSRQNQLTYTKPDPPFLRRIKQQIGYQAIPDVDTKKQSLDQADEKELEDRNDEKPTVVITENSNLTKEEQEDFAEKLLEVKPAKILFKKPVKKDERQDDVSKHSNDGKKSDTDKQGNLPSLKRPLEDRKSDEDKSKKVKQKEKNRLLSFDNDGDEEDF